MSLPVTNPIIKQTLHQQRSPSLRQCGVLLFGIGLACVLIAQLAPAFITSASTYYLARIVRYTLFFTVVSFPLVVLVTAAFGMAYTRTQDTFILLQQTTLSDTAVVRGYAFRILYRLRLPLTLLIGSIPLLTVALGDWRPMVQTGSLSAYTYLLLWSIGLSFMTAILGTVLVLRWGKPGLWSMLGIAVVVIVYSVFRLLPDLKLALIRISQYDFEHYVFLSRRGPSTLPFSLMMILIPYSIGLLARYITWRTGHFRRRVVEVALFMIIMLTLPVADAFAIQQVTERKRTLIAQMSSSDHAEASAAAARLARLGWSRDGTLNMAHLQYADLQHVILSRADMQGAYLNNANLSYTNLQGAGLQDVDLFQANLAGTNLQHADLYLAQLFSADLKNANLQNANMQRIDASDADFQGADLRHANLFAANLVAAHFRNANLQEAHLQEANLWSADLQGAACQHIDLQGADLRNADFTAANLTGASLQGAGFYGVNLRGVVMAEVNLLHAYDLTCAQLRLAEDLRGATLPDGKRLSAHDTGAWQQELVVWCEIREDAWWGRF